MPERPGILFVINIWVSVNCLVTQHYLLIHNALRGTGIHMEDLDME